jgi:hypothetical protein
VPPLHSSMVLPAGTKRSNLLTVCRIRITLALTCPQEGTGSGSRGTKGN